MLNAKLIRGSFVLLIAFGLFNFLGFAYQFAMARFLSLSEYGILATLFAMIYIFAIFSESIQTVITKYVTHSENPGQIRNLLRKSMNKGKFIATVGFGLYLIASLLFTKLFDIPYLLLALNGTLLYLVFLLPITRGTLQGRKQFIPLGMNLVVESSFKLLFSIGFVLIGWKVYGAIAGIILGTSVAFLLSFISLRDIYKSREENSNTKEIYSYAKPMLIITSIIVIFYSMDVILAKMLFSPEAAGAYAIASILGKMILWISVPVGKAMFPLSAESSQKGERKSNLFNTALVILGAIIIAMLTIFYFFSEFIVTFFSGKPVPEAAEILFYLGIAFSAIALANIILLYRLSLGSIKNSVILIVCNIFEIALLLFVSSSLKSFSIAFVVASIILLISSILFVRFNRHI